MFWYNAIKIIMPSITTSLNVKKMMPTFSIILFKKRHHLTQTPAFRPTSPPGLYISGWNFPCDLAGPLGWFVDFDFLFQNSSNWLRNSSPTFLSISKAIIGVPSAECHRKDYFAINYCVT